MKLNVVEVFDSIQGEGECMGMYCTFIRLPGCNYACPFCDTNFSKADVLLDTKKQPMQEHVVITGGEPSIHPKIARLIHELSKTGHFVHVESNGTNVAKLIEADWVTISPKRDEWRKTRKTPNWTKWPYNEIKLVVDEQFDEKQWLSESGHIWLQPCDGPYLEQSKKRIMELVKRYPDKFRAGIQLHKYYEVV